MTTTIDGLRKRRRLADDARIGLKAPQPTSVVFDPAQREITMIVNTADVDLEDEVVVPKGCLESEGGSMKYIRQNKKVFWGHDYASPAIGMIRNEPQLKRQGWFARTVLFQIPFCDDLITMMDQGGYPAASIGFEALEARRPNQAEVKQYGEHDFIIPRWHWLEYSLTHMPMNVSCQASEMHGKAEPDEDMLVLLDESLSKGAIRRKSAMMMGLPMPKGKAVTDTPTRDVITLGDDPVELG